uniref:BRCT domain-containing protein n=1 Tax=Steinernema glaseri TaxID=37863 RepID=A0A1I7YKV7_9BILA
MASNTRIPQDWLVKTCEFAGPLNSTMKPTGAPMQDLSLSVIHESTTVGIKEKAELKVIYFAGVENELKQRLTRIVEDLGGMVDADGNGGVSHLITPAVTNGIKIVKGIARGLWVLTPEFLTQCRKEGRFVSEEPYEHGQSGKTNDNNTKIGEKYEQGRRLATVCRPWRLEVASSPEYVCGAYSGWNVVVCGGILAEAVVELIKLAGGNAQMHHDIGANFTGLTHALFESKNCGYYEKSARKLLELKIPIHRLDHPIDFLIKEQQNNRNISSTTGAPKKQAERVKPRIFEEASASRRPSGLTLSFDDWRKLRAGTMGNR